MKHYFTDCTLKTAWETVIPLTQEEDAQTCLKCSERKLMELSGVGATSNVNGGSTLATETPKAATRQNLEPNSVEIWNDAKGNVMFSVKSFKADLNSALEECVEVYNRMARVLKRGEINLSNAVLPQIESVTESEDSILEEKLIRKKDSPKNFGGRLHQLRLASGKKIKETAEFLGISAAQLSDIECGLYKITPAKLFEFAEFANLSEKDLGILQKLLKKSVRPTL